MRSASQMRVQDVSTTPRGWHVVTVPSGQHEIRIAYPPGRRKKGSGHVVQILHPPNENQNFMNCVNPVSELVIFGNPDRATRGYGHNPRGKKQNASVGNEILAQLGGNKFIGMTGARNFVGGANSLSFRLPGSGGFTKNGINAVRIELTAKDTYKLTFSRIRGSSVSVVSERDDVYADSLREVFREETGLETSLGSMGNPRRRGRNVISEVPDPAHPGEKKFAAWRSKMLRFISSHWYGGTLSNREFQEIARITHMPPGDYDWSFIRDSEDDEVRQVYELVTRSHETEGPHKGFNPKRFKSAGRVLRGNPRDKYFVEIDGKPVSGKGHATIAQAKKEARKFRKRGYNAQVMRYSGPARPGGDVRTRRVNAGGRYGEKKATWFGKGYREGREGRKYQAPADPSLAGEYDRGYKHGQALRSRRPNQGAEASQEAVKLFQVFHGKEAEQIIEKQRSAAMRHEYVCLGNLDYIDVRNAEGKLERIDFEGDGVKLASSSEGTQFYLIGGNQNLNGALSKLVDDTTKDVFDLGEAVEIQYTARKAHTNFEPTSWYHEFGEENGDRPRLLYDKLKREVFFAGGSYYIDVNVDLSPGIEN